MLLTNTTYTIQDRNGKIHNDRNRGEDITKQIEIAGTQMLCRAKEKDRRHIGNSISDEIVNWGISK